MRTFLGGVILTVLAMTANSGHSSLLAAPGSASQPPPVVAAGTVFHVSPQGNDRWSGRVAAPNAKGTDGPLATLSRARDPVRNAKSSRGAVTVYLHGGNYEIPEPVHFPTRRFGSAGRTDYLRGQPL
jgi:hypothetical protein